jgi:hypothetical protein
LRRDSATNWSNAQTAAGATPILAAGEIGYITSGTGAGNFKIGDGTTLWGALPFAPAGAASTAVTSTTAGKLTSPVAINGTNFDGSTAIEVKGAIYDSGYTKITVKAGSTGPSNPVAGDVWISF